MNPHRHVLVIGGQRSGKSRFAEALVTASDRDPVYIATAQARDAEMTARIAEHRRRRGDAWETVEEPLELPAALARAAGDERIILVDCLTLWLANLMDADRPVEPAAEALLGALARAACPVVMVSNEVGSGIVPDNALARRFADAQGTLNQMVAGAVDEVVLMAAGIPVRIKPAPQSEILL